ncbi:MULTISPECIES: peptidoglycan DD-metalloendopeptidase family protein [unclassified Modicisalibacter]|uniref:murein hydrolase activator EnvC family protein n=1 Tax=unclassified Modicisalibacter TaxID=2679913 RepID=UPI001CCDA0FD|nr:MULTISPECIES: peptidoglycan DD-metalloendopeptidase family protein [unclassified Modicisalibacter]
MRRPAHLAALVSFLVGTTLGGVLVGPAAQAAPSPEKADERAAESRLDKLGQALKALDTRLTETREARSEASRQLEKVETALTRVHERLASLQAERRQLDDEVADLEQRRQTLQAQRRTQRKALARQLAALYRLGESPQLKLLLNQDDPARLDRLQTYLNHLSRARNERLEALARLDAQLATTRDDLEQRRRRLADLADELDDQRRTLAQRQQERKELVARLDARYRDDKARREDLADARTAAEKQLARIREQLKRLDQPPPSTAIDKTRGDLPWPVPGRVVAGFGDGDGVDRNGLLIAAPAGTPVEAIHAGRVVFADWMRGYGNLLIVDHGDDVMTLYAHVQRFAVSVGQHIEDGQAVATVGESGGRASPALYFEVRKDGEPIDPRRWIRRR